MAEAGKGIKMQRDVVRDNSIFREKVKAEKRHAVLNENFDFNPKYLVSVSEKVASKHTSSLRSAVEDVMDLKNKLQTLT